MIFKAIERDFLLKRRGQLIARKLSEYSAPFQQWKTASREPEKAGQNFPQNEDAPGGSTASYPRYNQSFQNGNAAQPQWNNAASQPSAAAARPPYQPSSAKEKESFPHAAVADASGNLPFGAEFNDVSNFANIYSEAGKESFAPEIAQILNEPVNEELIEVKPGQDVLYLPEVHYRRILTKAFGPGGWALIPRGPHSLNGKTLSREYALVCHGRCVAVARGSAVIQGFNSAAASTESVKSNALMRTCKDLGIAWQLWDPHFVAEFKLKKGMLRSAASRY